MIDTATEADIPALAAMLRQLNAVHVAGNPLRFHDYGTTGERQAFFAEALASGARVLVYRVEGGPRGYLMWRLRRPGCAALERPRRMALLEHVFVEPICRRRGMGSRLIRRFEADIGAEGCAGWVTAVHGSNASSRALMRQAGARPTLEMLERRFQTPA